jgi:hypothetical protein
LLATWRVGAAAACLDASLTPGELRNVIGFAKPSLMLFDGRAPEENFPVPIVDLSKVRPKIPRAIARAIDPKISFMSSVPTFRQPLSDLPSIKNPSLAPADTDQTEDESRR